MALDLEKTNSEIQNWGSSAAGDMRARGSAMNIQHRAGNVKVGDRTLTASNSPRPSLAQLVARYKYANGLVHIVSFRVTRSLIYSHHGAGKGMGGTKGSSWVDQYGNTKKTRSSSFGKAGTGSRKSKPFFNAALEAPTGIETLGEVVATQIGDAFVKNLLIK